MTEDEVRLLLHELRNEPVPADSLVRVRLAVAQGSRRETWLQRLGARWKILGLLTAAAVILVIAVRVRPVHQTSTPTAAIQHSAAVVEVPSRPATSNRDAKVSTNVAAKPKIKDPRKTAPKDGDVLVRIETADPDVVILLIGD
jgi:anti-sigma factor RsiW